MKTTIHLKKLLFILVLGSMALFNADLHAQEIKVMTYNIYHGEFHETPGKSNLEQVAELIRKHQPDFVAMQEVDSMTSRSASLHHGVPKDLVKELAKMTGMHGFFGKAIEYAGGGYGEGILSRFPTQSRNIALPVPMGGEGRALLLVSHTFPNGQEIVFGGTHLCHEHDANREAQAAAICEILAKEEAPVIMGGDFNIHDNSKAYAIIAEDFTDAAVQFGNPQNTIPYGNPSARIDYIFLSKNHTWIIKDVEVLKNDASDHMPVLVTLELKAD